MTKTIKSFTVSIMILLAATVLVGCAGALNSLDVASQQSTVSFDAVLNEITGNVSGGEQMGSWTLAAPDGQASFVWSTDYSKSSPFDVSVRFDAQPFKDAGLDVTKLPANYTTEGDSIEVGQNLGDEPFEYSGKVTALSSYEQLIASYRDVINYHTPMDHFGIMLGDGNMFEWAKDMVTNGTTKENQDKDIVFVLNPEPLINAGVDPEKVAGWVYTQVEVEEDGKPVEVWKFLKPYDVKK